MLRVYWTNHMAAAIRAAATDGCDVCSISWGASEATLSPELVNDIEVASAAAGVDGMMIFASAGDNDAKNGGPLSVNVDVPASCPHVIGCGGTSKTSTTEVVWNNQPGEANGTGTGGGYSVLFPASSWQDRGTGWPRKDRSGCRRARRFEIDSTSILAGTDRSAERVQYRLFLLVCFGDRGVKLGSHCAGVVGESVMFFGYHIWRQWFLSREGRPGIPAQASALPLAAASRPGSCGHRRVRRDKGPSLRTVIANQGLNSEP